MEPRRTVQGWATAAVVVAIIVVATIGALYPRTAAAVEQPEGRVEAIDCPLEVPATAEVDCGRLIVPEDHHRPDGPMICLPYVFLRSTSGDPAPDPVVYSPGSPGHSSLVPVWAFASSPDPGAARHHRVRATGKPIR